MLKLYHENKIVWYVIPYTKGKYQISNYGDVRRVLQHVFDRSELKKKGFSFFTEKVQSYSKQVKLFGINFNIPLVVIEQHGTYVQRAINSLMYESILGVRNLNYLNIVHLDGNDFNFNLENLLICTEYENATYKSSCYLRKSKPLLPCVNKFNNNKDFVHTKFKSYCISEYNTEGIRTNLYAGIVDFCRDKAIDRISAVRILKNIDYSFYGKFYLHGYGPWKIDLSLINNKHIKLEVMLPKYGKKNIIQLDSRGFLKNVYNNLIDASFSNQLPSSEIKRAIIQNKKYEQSYWFKDEKNINIYR